MKTYWVTFDFADYICESTWVYADNILQVKQIMKNQYGNDVKVRSIELED